MELIPITSYAPKPAALLQHRYPAASSSFIVRASDRLPLAFAFLSGIFILPAAFVFRPTSTPRLNFLGPLNEIARTRSRIARTVCEDLLSGSQIASIEGPEFLRACSGNYCFGLLHATGFLSLTASRSRIRLAQATIEALPGPENCSRSDRMASAHARFLSSSESTESLRFIGANLRRRLMRAP